MPAVKAADPAATPDALDGAFAAAMGAPIRPREAPAPPEIDPDAPHGRGDDGQPLAPFGLTKDGKIRRSAAGRKAKAEPDEQPRTAPPGSVPDGGGKGGTGDGGDGGKLPAKDYTESLAATSEALWVGLTMASMAPLERIPIVSALPVPQGKGKPALKLGDLLADAKGKIAAQAHIFNRNRGALVGALQLAANNNQRARNLAEKLETGDATWALVCGAMVMPFMSQSVSLWSGTLAEDELPSVAELAAANEQSMGAWVAKFNSELQAASEDATPDLGAMNGHVRAEAA